MNRCKKSSGDAGGTVREHVIAAKTDQQTIKRIDAARVRQTKSNGRPWSRGEYVRQAVLAALDRDEQSGLQAAACGGNAGPGPAASKRKV